VVFDTPLHECKGFYRRSTSLHLAGQGVLMEIDRTSSRCAPTLIQIWASVATATSFAHCDGCSGDSRPYPSIVGLPRPRPRRAFGQVTSKIAQVFLPVTVRLYSFLMEYLQGGPCSFLQIPPVGGAADIPMHECRGFTPRSGNGGMARRRDREDAYVSPSQQVSPQAACRRYLDSDVQP